MKKQLVTLVAMLWLLSTRPLRAQGVGPLTLFTTTPLPEITGGDFDHFAVNLKDDRLYVVSEVYASIESSTFKRALILRA